MCVYLPFDGKRKEKKGEEERRGKREDENRGKVPVEGYAGRASMLDSREPRICTCRTVRIAARPVGPSPFQ